MRRIALFALKTAITALLIYLSVRTVSLEAVSERMRMIKLPWIALVLVVLAAQIALQAIRWQQVIHAAGQPLPAGPSLRISFVGAFFNQTLPSTIGGDAMRIWMLAQTYQAGWKVAAYAVLVDRAIGVFSLAVLVVVCLPWTFAYVPDPAGRMTVTLVGVAGIAGGLIFAALPAIRATWIEKLWGFPHLIEASSILPRLTVPVQRTVFVAAASLAIHVITVFVIWAIAQAIAAPAGFLLLMCLIPPVILIATVPITIAGWGLRESLMITAFVLAGLDAGDALTISLLFGVAQFVVGLPGGVSWITGRLGVASAEPPQ